VLKTSAPQLWAHKYQGSGASAHPPNELSFFSPYGLDGIKMAGAPLQGHPGPVTPLRRLL
jgi:hypothetical protein